MCFFSKAQKPAKRLSKFVLLHQCNFWVCERLKLHLLENLAKNVNITSSVEIYLSLRTLSKASGKATSLRARRQCNNWFAKPSYIKRQSMLFWNALLKAIYCVSICEWNSTIQMSSTSLHWYFFFLILLMLCKVDEMMELWKKPVMKQLKWNHLIYQAYFSEMLFGNDTLQRCLFEMIQRAWDS